MRIGAIFVIEGNRRKVLFPRDFNISGTVKGAIVDLFIQQVYFNETDKPLDFNYLYNSNGSCLYGTTFYIGDEKIELKVEEKKTAESTFQEAKESGQTAALSRMLPNGLTEFVIGNVPPKTECRLEAHLAYVLKIHENEILLKIPLALSNDRSYDSKISLVDKQFNFSLNLQLDIKDISKVTLTGFQGTYNSDTHKIECQKILPNSKPLIHITTTNPVPSGAIISNDSKYLAITAIHSPNEVQSSSSSINSDYVIIVDCSGSMSGSRINSVRECLNCFLRSMPRNCAFDIIKFGSEAKSLFNGLKEYNQESMELATSLANNLQADMGGTNILNALKIVFNTQIRDGRAVQIFLLTDGEVSDREDTIKYMAGKRDLSRIFGLGIGDGADLGLLKLMAKETNGDYDLISQTKDTTTKVIRLLKTARVPAVVNIAINISDDSK